MKYHRITFGERVRELRESGNWTQTELAERAEMSRSYLSLIERDEAQSISLSVFLRMGVALEIGALEFLEMYLEVTDET